MKSFRFLLTLIVAAIVCSCGNQQSASNVPGPDPDAGMPPMALNAGDTLSVKKVVADFMDLLQQNKLNEAVYSLYDNSETDESGTPMPLSEEKCQDLLKLYKGIDVDSYNVIDMVFTTHEVNLVKCKVVSKDGSSLILTFNPKRAYAKWYLTIKG